MIITLTPIFAWRVNDWVLARSGLMAVDLNICMCVLHDMLEVHDL